MSHSLDQFPKHTYTCFMKIHGCDQSRSEMMFNPYPAGMESDAALPLYIARPACTFVQSDQAL